METIDLYNYGVTWGSLDFFDDFFWRSIIFPYQGLSDLFNLKETKCVFNNFFLVYFR